VYFIYKFLQQMSVSVTQAALPSRTLLEPYGRTGGYVDCFIADLRQAVTLPDLITAFYTSWAFRPERWLLGGLLGKHADNAAVARLASGEIDRFSAWSVEARCDDEILLCDYQGKTRSWLMVQSQAGGTRVHFGSAVVPAKSRVDRMAFAGLLSFHRWYSRQLLKAAVSRL